MRVDLENILMWILREHSKLPDEEILKHLQVASTLEVKQLYLERVQKEFEKKEKYFTLVEIEQIFIQSPSILIKAIFPKERVNEKLSSQKNTKSETNS